jgi:hypothetical protein
LAIFVMLMLVGCAANPAPKTAVPATQPRFEEAASSALVFKPRAVSGEPELALSRAGRAPEAFVGFDSITTTYQYLRYDDQMGQGTGDRYERRAISVQVGVSQR